MKTGYVSIVGKANVGKSTLLNRLVGRVLSITTPKPQTTRRKILGIWTEGDNQIIFRDTPGLFKPKNELEKAMQHNIESAMSDTDIILHIVEANKPGGEQLPPRTSSIPTFLLLNKIDLVEKDTIDERLESLETERYDEVFLISALRGDNVDRIIPKILEYLPEEHPLYPGEDLSDRPERFFIEEIIREKIFKEYYQEIPYATAVRVINMTEDRIDVKIYVEKESQKGIIIGKNGKKLKKVATEARKDIEEFLGEHIYLDVWVSVRKKWRKKKKELERLGYYE